MRTDEIREAYLKFYESKGHQRYPSDSVVPANDPSILFTTAGMAQFKDMFLGIGKLPHKRITTAQKCLRVGDLENVGRTKRHHTFFEMLGNFSFGDYFKEQAIPWCWEFYTKVLGLPPALLWPSIWEKDEESAELWTRLVAPPNPITRLGEGDNFWPAHAPSKGPNGPCGPCSELYYDFGKGPWWCDKCERPGCDCDRFVEIGNIVFTQYDRRDVNVLDPLPRKNIDFGGGLERVSAVVQGVKSSFDTDTFKAIIRSEEDALHAKYSGDHELGRRFRRIADHVRALCFCISDGARPSNEGRGYVVRRILRTAFRDGWKIGARETFMHKVVGTVVDVMGRQYPELVERRAAIETAIKTEEEQFLKTIERGLTVIDELASKLKKSGEKSLSGKDALLLYESHGFPIELTIDVLADQSFDVDREAFKRELDLVRRSEKHDVFDPNSSISKLKEQKVPITRFLGYDIRVADLSNPVEAVVQRIVKLDAKALEEFNASKKDMARVSGLIGRGAIVDSAATGDLVAVLLDRTPFYAEGGGQIGDAGWLRAGDATVEVSDTRKPDGYFFHLGKVTQGTLKPGKAQAQVDAARRLDVMRNHTGTHLLHAALRSVLGAHVTQAGSVVEPNRLRFDFTHPKALTKDEVRAIEDWVNRVVFDDREVTKVEMPMDEAKKTGALMMFGEKYGERVRVVSVGGDKSVEFCGGTHLEHSATIGGLRITSESAIGSGVRRIEAVTGPGVIDASRRQDEFVQDIAKELGCPINDIPRKLKQLATDVQSLKSEIGKLRKGGASAGAGIDQLIANAKQVNGEQIVAAKLDSGDVDFARSLMDQLTKQKKIAAAILAIDGEKTAFVIGVREDLVKSKGLRAGDLAKEVGKACGGGGGGREIQAQAGASDASKIGLGLETFENAVRTRLGGNHG